MTKSISHSLEPLHYESVRWISSRSFSGVRYATRRVSLAQRIELTRLVRDLMRRDEFLRAGDAADQVEAGLADLLVRKLYVEWGLVEIEGLEIDGAAATPQLLIDAGPEELTDEIAASIQGELSLTEEERKNF
jgi:hypothetical protein